MVMHPNRFVKLVDEALANIREVTIQEIKEKIAGGDPFYLVDVREESEWAKDHLPHAVHLGKGIIERDIENAIPDVEAEIALYCGSGFRSALAAENLQRMGYKNVSSVSGGIRAWREAGYELVKE